MKTMNILKTTLLSTIVLAAASASAALTFSAGDADFSSPNTARSVAPIQTTQTWVMGGPSSDWDVVSGAMADLDGNDRLQALAYVFDNTTSPTTGEITLSFDYNNSSGTQGASLAVTFFGYSSSQTGVISLPLVNSSNAIPYTTGKLDVGGAQYYVGDSYATALAPIASSASTTFVGSGGSGTFFETFDLGATAYDRIAMVVWNENRFQGTYDDFAITPVPEPSTFALLAGMGALGFILYRRRR